MAEQEFNGHQSEITLSFSTKLVTIGLAVVIVAVAAGITFMLVNIKEEEKEAPPPAAVKRVNTAVVEYKNHDAVITEYGRINSRSKADVYSEVSGKLISSGRLFKEGAQFGSGSVIFRVENEDVKLNLYAMRSDFLTQLINILPDIKSDYPSAFNEWEKYLEDFDIKENLGDLPEIKDPKLKYFLASRNVFRTYYNIRNSEYRLTKYVIRSPISGVVTQAMAEPGMNIMPGQKLGSITGTGIFELEIPLEKRDLDYFKVGDKADVYYEEQGLQWNGRVARIGKNLDPATMTVSVFITVSGKGLKDGMYLKADIYGGEIDNAFRIPRKALVNNRFIYIIRDSVLDKTDVDLVRVNENYAYIRGVPDGTVAITDPLSNISLGIKVLPLNDNKN